MNISWIKIGRTIVCGLLLYLFRYLLGFEYAVIIALSMIMVSLFEVKYPGK